MALTFADTHNMIAFLTKSDASEGFNQIIDFLNASSIKYALTVNPNIYVSVIKQFWSSVVVKKVNDVSRLQALIDRKKVIITEATFRGALRLDDAEGIECLPNEEIFTELARMGYEKPSTKLTFYKANKVLHVFMISAIDDKGTSWVGKGCSRVETPPFEGMIVAQQVGEGASMVNVDDVPTGGVNGEDTCTTLTRRVKNLEHDKIAQALEITKLKQRVKKLDMRNKASKLRRLKKVGTAQRIETSNDTIMDDVSKQRRIIADMDADQDVTMKDVAAVAKDDVDIEPTELQKVVEVVTIAKLITKVVTTASATITTAAPQLTTAAALILTTAPSATRMRMGVVIRDPKETATPSKIIHT
nr:xylulose kinase-1 [Tanacetum cinerariifolium]